MKPDAIFTHTATHLSEEEILTLAVECGLYPGEAMKNLWWVKKMVNRVVVDEQRRLQKKVAAVLDVLVEQKKGN